MPDLLVSDIGHIAIPVRDMKQAPTFYRDILGFTVEGKEDEVWTVIAVKGGHSRSFVRRILRLSP